ncbi:MAG: RagB/SusD family nutrient uptake outer membrane protein [Bacteroidales bacterium]|jgi:hypothetical protein|nr:RagB/SusD family nutrient uptake outer membrane protein [Bacteroidales bacterium]
MKLKKLILNGLTGVLLLFAISCQEEFLSEIPYSYIGPENFYNNADELELMVNSVYTWGDRTLSDMFGRNWWMIIEMPAPAVSSRYGISNSRQMFDAWTYSASTPELAMGWNELYIHLNRANAVISNGELMDDNKEEPAGYNKVDRVMAEAKFHRALFYFYLTELWGDVPLRTQEVVSLDNLYIGGTPRDSIRQVIIEDLKYAESNLPQWTEYSDANHDIGRVCKAAAQALLAKVYLTTGQYSDALSYCDAIINAGIHGLAPNYKKLWFMHNPEGSENYSALNYEIIYDIQHSRSVGQEGTLSPNIAPRNSSYCREQWTNFAAEYWFVKSFEEGDDRLEGSFVMEYVTTRDFEKHKKGDLVRFDVDNIHTDGYVEEGPAVLKWLDPDPTFMYHEEPNYSILRYPDVLLMKAEALDKLGRTNDAYMYVNIVRRRAFGLDPYTPAPAVDWTVGSKDNFRKELYIERLKELSMESWGTIDLRRLWDVAAPIVEMSSKMTIIQKDGSGNDKEVANASPKTEINPSDKFKLFPIPITILQRNSALNQNTEWD